MTSRTGICAPHHRIGSSKYLRFCQRVLKPLTIGERDGKLARYFSYIYRYLS
jgi:hypothetical protein